MSLSKTHIGVYCFRNISNKIIRENTLILFMYKKERNIWWIPSYVNIPNSEGVSAPHDPLRFPYIELSFDRQHSPSLPPPSFIFLSPHPVSSPSIDQCPNSRYQRICAFDRFGLLSAARISSSSDRTTGGRPCRPLPSYVSNSSRNGDKGTPFPCFVSPRFLTRSIRRRFADFTFELPEKKGQEKKEGKKKRTIALRAAAIPFLSSLFEVFCVLASAFPRIFC